MKRVGKDVAASERWHEKADHYASVINRPYHRHRLDVIRSLLPELSSRRVVDFGCGEGVLVGESLRLGAASIVGIDIEDRLLSKAKEREPEGVYIQGGVDRLSEFATHEVDCMISANVLAYLTDEEEARFYFEAARIIRPGGHLVVTHSNNLFDLFTLNAFTVAFYRDQFNVDPTELLTRPAKPDRMSFNVRENPLSYPHKLKRNGFVVEHMEFINRHLRPPLLSGDDPDDLERERPDTLGVPIEERWKLLFQCSTFGVRAARQDT